MKNTLLNEEKQSNPPDDLEPPPSSCDVINLISQKTLNFKNKFYPEIPISSWNDWKWQFKNTIRKISDLEKIINLKDDEHIILTGKTSSGIPPLSITPYYASLINADDPFDAIRKTVVPSVEELKISPDESIDPLCEDEHTKLPGLVHRYPDRVLVLTTQCCSVYCRYCTRSRIIDNSEYSNVSFDKIVEYISNNPQIRDVVLSGGDILTMCDSKIENILSRIRAIKHVEVIRIGTKVPMVMPQRITDELVNMLKKYHPLWMSIHVIHPNEITLESKIAVEKLANAGIVLGSQSVLLKGVNDNAEIMADLCKKLMAIRIRPYYLYQCDQILGSKHFRTTIDTGIDIIAKMRGFISGYAVPNYVIDAPGGGGKIPVMQNYVVEKTDKKIVLKNYQNKQYVYAEV